MPVNLAVDRLRLPQTTIPNVAAAFAERDKAAANRAAFGLKERQVGVQEAGVANQAAQLRFQQEKFQKEQEQKEIEKMGKRINLSLQIVAGVRDQASNAVARKQLLTIGVPQENIDALVSETFDPANVKNARTRLRAAANKFKPFILSPGQVALDPQTGEEFGRGLEKAPRQFAPQFELFEGPQGGQRQIKKGDPIPKAFKKVFKPEATRLGGAIEQKKTALKNAFPELDDQTATGIAAGTIKVITDPVTGQSRISDIIAGTTKPLRSLGKDLEDVSSIPSTPIAGQGPTIFELSDLATGPLSAIKQGTSIITGSIGLPIFAETARARQFVLTAQNDLIRALTINRRFPVGEIKRIKEEMSIEPKLFDNPKLMRERIRSIDRFLKIRLQKEQRASVDTELPVTSRKNARDAINDIENFLQILGNPPSFNDPSDSEFQVLPDGALFYWNNQLMRKGK